MQLQEVQFQEANEEKLSLKNEYHQHLTLKQHKMVKINMLKWAKDLFPICRSITGNGTRRTLNYFKRINPEFKTIKFSSGKKVFDWVIPLEWNIKDAFFKHENGKKFAEFKKSNLHVVGYSVPIKKTLNKKELIKHVYTQKKSAKCNSLCYKLL